MEDFMYEQEKQRATHLMILLCYTFFTILLIGESLLLGWETGAIVLLLLGLVASWIIHITEKLPEAFSLWLYFILTMLSVFFYGIHETSIFDLAPLMIVIIIMYSATEMNSIINLCIVTYYLTMCYDFFVVLGASVELTSLSTTRVLLHLILVYVAGWLAKMLIRWRSKERKNTDDKIAELEETNRRTEDFMANVSHELRTPINAVTGITAVMLKNEEDTEKRRNLFSIQMAGHRLFSQIEDILDYTEIDTGKIKVSEDTYVLSSIVNDIIMEKRMQDREHVTDMIFDIDTGIPSALIGDGRKIKKILSHLIDNAVKFTQKGGVYIRIYTLPKSYGINLCIKVSDTGVGIDGEDLGKITERFYQSNGGRNRRVGGLGLGLPIVSGMVNAMEGFIQIASNVGSGTTVSISIPQKVADATPGMVVENREKLCLACFLKHEKYQVPEIREYYNEMISHMVQGLDIPLHRVSDIDELKKLISLYQLTHLFIGREEYEEEKSFFEGLDKSTEVVVVADEGFILPQDSRVKLLIKPFCTLSIINILNAGASENTEQFKEKRLLCPGVKVLVVDDEPMNLMVAEGIFKNYQMNVTKAEGGRKAIELCEKEDFDLVFLDHMMPEMDGIETLKRLRKLHTDTDKVLTVIAFTANAVSGAREMFLQEGFDEFVSKPIETLELERILRKVLPKSAVSYVDENSGKVKIAENTEKQEIEEDEITCLEKLGINTEEGLQYCQGDRKFYVELLTRFAKDAACKETEINDFFKQEDFENYRIRVHALKSTAKMIGADSLSEMAKSIEEAAKNHEAGFIREHQEELLNQYREVVQYIENVFASGKSVSAQDSIENYIEVSADELFPLLEELKESLDTFEIDKAETLIAEMDRFIYQGISLSSPLQDVRQDVEDFEFGAAALKVESLISSAKGGEA
ncbi:MAG: response regulator [Lachnospiraceae bacterium]